MRTLVINKEGLSKLREEHHVALDGDLAKLIKVNKGTVSRALSGKSKPSEKFIAGMLLTFPVKFEQIFDAVETDLADESAA